MSSAVYNPDSVWQVPDGFRPIYSHAVEVPEGEAVTVAVVSALARPEFLIEVEAVAAMRRGA